MEWGRAPGKPTLTFYTSGGATTPQLAFWHAVERGKILEKCNLRVKLWKNLDGIRALLLAGEGDLWLGHTDGFVQAALRGAPVRLMLTSGWKKFYLVSLDGTGFQDFCGNELAFAPPAIPAVPLLKRIMGGDSIVFKAHEPRQLSLGMIRGDIRSALVPEPLVTLLLERVPGLRVKESVEACYGRFTGGPSRMPIAGLAVNARTARAHPELMAFLVREILASARALEENPAVGVGCLPREFENFIPRDLVLKSLGRDEFCVVESRRVREEIQTYLSLVMGLDSRDFPRELYWP